MYQTSTNILKKITATRGKLPALTISQLLPSGAGRVAAIYSDPARPSYDECIQKNMAAIAAGRPQDCVLFSDAAGQTPVVYPIGAGQGKGLLLDRSAGLVRGPELAATYVAVNSPGTSPTLPAVLTSVTAGTCGIRTPAFTTAHKQYVVRVSWTGNTGGLGVRIAASGDYTFPSSTAVSGTLTAVIGSSSATEYGWGFFTAAGAGQSITITEFSVRELPGHHQQQRTAAARGEFSRRVNYLTDTEQLVSTWTPQTCTVTQGAETFDGRPVALLTATTAAANQGYLRTVPTAASTFGRHVFSAVAKRDTSLGVRLQTASVIDGANAGVVASFNLETLEASAYTYGAGNFVVESQSLTPLGDGYYHCQIVYTMTGTAFTAATQNRIYPYLEGDVAPASAYVTRADGRFAADAIPSIPAYQRVTTASDYDEVGFPTYWRAQTDDWAKSHMDPAGATKSYVFWAGQKMSDAAIGIVVELSANGTTTSNTFTLGAPSDIAPIKYMGWRSRGSELAYYAATPDEIYSAPRKAAVVGIGDISADTSILLIDGTEAATSTADQGTGTYNEHDVFFGARGGTSLFANIREYAPPLILFLQPADSLSASHLSKLQRGYAKAVGVTL